MIIAAYLIHEFAHGAIFSVPKHNEWAGNVCSWLCGSCYAEFQDLRKKHMRHHVDRADVITFDSKAFLKARPLWFQKLVLALEWAYVPAVELIMHFYVIALPSSPTTTSTAPGAARSPRCWPFAHCSLPGSRCSR